MYIVDKINNEFKEKVIIFSDMDGVITDYNFGHKLDFKTKRPIKTNINTLNKLSELPNVDLFILSICNINTEIDEKNNWLDEYAPFIKKENRIILSKEKFKNLKSKEMKCIFLKEFMEKNDSKIIVIDDDNEILKYLKSEIKDIYLLQDSSIID